MTDALTELREAKNPDGSLAFPPLTRECPRGFRYAGGEVRHTDSQVWQGGLGNCSTCHGTGRIPLSDAETTVALLELLPVGWGTVRGAGRWAVYDTEDFVQADHSNLNEALAQAVLKAKDGE